MLKNECTGDHAVHICEFAKQQAYEKIVGVTGTPGSICINCGRVANAKENLCNPVSFSEILKDGVYLSR